MPLFLAKVVPSEEGLGSSSHLFHRPLDLTLTGQPDRLAVTPTVPQGLRPNCSRRCATALLRFSTNRSLAGRCAANFQGLLMLQTPFQSNNKIERYAIFLSTTSPQAGPRRPFGAQRHAVKLLK